MASGRLRALSPSLDPATTEVVRSRPSSSARWSRGVVRQQVRTRKRPPVLLLLEEFAGLKYMEKLETAAAQLAGTGVKLW